MITNELLDKVRLYLELGGNPLEFHAELRSKKFQREYPVIFGKIKEIQASLLREEEEKRRLRTRIWLDILKEIWY